MEIGPIMTDVSHFDEQGNIHMVDVSQKEVTARTAAASGEVRVSPAVIEAINKGTVTKGNVLLTAQIAGIAGAKKCSDLIPLCHPIPVQRIDVDCRLAARKPEVEITATAAARWSTGVEMEALTAVAAAALTLYDMCKSIDRGILVKDLRLLSKSGGRTGTWKRKTKS